MDDFTLNTKLIRSHYNRNVAQLANLDFIWQELAERVISRLDYIKLSPNKILDCGSGLGFDRGLLVNKFPQAKIIELDIALDILKLHNSPKKGLLTKIFQTSNQRSLICGDAKFLPIANTSVEFLYANLLLPFIDDVPAFIREARRVLSLGGAFCLSGLGVDSFKELRALGLTTYRFPDMHDIGDMLIDAGFSNPVVDTEYITLDYDDLTTMINDIQLIGCGAASNQQNKVKRNTWLDLQSKKHLPQKLTLEIFVAHGWKDQHKLDLPAGQSIINFKK